MSNLTEKKSEIIYKTMNLKTEENFDEIKLNSKKNYLLLNQAIKHTEGKKLKCFERRNVDMNLKLHKYVQIDMTRSFIEEKDNKDVWMTEQGELVGAGIIQQDYG